MRSEPHTQTNQGDQQRFMAAKAVVEATPVLPATQRTGLVSPTVFGFVAGGLAACMAVTFTNPLEVVKTRMQLQGERLDRVSPNGGQRPYRGTFSGFATIARNEGIRGLQRGLGAGYVYQLCLNGTRLGLYGPTKALLTQLWPTATNGSHHVCQPATKAGSANNTAVNIASGMVAGIAGAILGSPLYLIKTRMQSYSEHLAVGHQHRYRGTWAALGQILRQDGLRGLFRGVDAAMLRTGVGSAVQLSMYDFSKDLLLRLDSDGRVFQPGAFATYSTASLMTGLVVCMAMNPFDVVSTRMYNQKSDHTSGKGALYRNPWDCLVKTLRYEGPAAFYKAIVPQYLRLGPHTILMFIFMENIHHTARALHLITV